MKFIIHRGGKSVCGKLCHRFQMVRRGLDIKIFDCSQQGDIHISFVPDLTQEPSVFLTTRQGASPYVRFDI